MEEKKIRSIIRNILKENFGLKSKSDKGNRYFKMLKTAEFQHYDSPKGELSKFTKGEEDRKRLVSKLSKEDKVKYKEWLKTEDGKKSIELFDDYASEGNKIKDANKSVVNENEEKFVIDKYGDKLKIDKAWSGFSWPVPEFKTRVKDSLVDIITTDRGISEKAFSAYDNVIKEVAEFFKDNIEMDEMMNNFEGNKARSEYIAEKIYNEFYPRIK